MREKERQKICISCDGRIALETQECPYCGILQNQPQLEKESPMAKQVQPQDSLAPLYPPTYSAKNAGQMNTDEKKTPSLFREPEKRFAGLPSTGFPPMSPESKERSTDDKSSFWPLFLLSIGANLFLLGLLQLLFSHQGRLQLEWNSHYWFIYCLIALPLVFLGFRKVNRLER